MWDRETYGFFVEHGQMKIGIILRCRKIKTLFGCMMTGVFLWLCCMIVKEYKLGCWMVECIWLECVMCCVWWPLKMAQMGWKMDFDGMMGCEKLELYFNGVWTPFYCRLAEYLWLLWWCLFADWSCLKKKLKCKKCIFNFFVSQPISTLITDSWGLGEFLRYGLGGYLRYFFLHICIISDIGSPLSACYYANEVHQESRGRGSSQFKSCRLHGAIFSRSNQKQ